jgi:Fis1 N-terminal tetratricopeptide repeat
MEQDQKEPLVSHELSENDLEMLHQEFLKNPSSTQLKFNFAWGLVNSTSKDNFATAIALFNEIYNDSPSRRREVPLSLLSLVFVSPGPCRIQAWKL